MELVDLHTHFLPGIDDGPATIDQTVELLRGAHEGGTRHIVATPHVFHPTFGNDAQRVKDTFEAVRSELARRAEEPGCRFLKEMSLYVGSENFVSSEFLEALTRRELVTLNRSRYTLIELARLMTPDMAQRALARLLDAGLVPVIAHVERYPLLWQRLSLLERLVKDGCLTLVNAEALVRSAPASRRKVLSWLRDGLVHGVTSDTHDLARRPPSLAGACAELHRRFTDEEVKRWMVDNPSLILADRPLPVA